MTDPMEETNNNTCDSDEDDELCVVCCKYMQICSIMDCQHTICHECSTRLRVLCKKLECPICRQKTTIALFSSQRGPFQSLYLRSLYTDDRYKLAFEDAHARQAFDHLLAHQCPLCKGDGPFSTFKQLQQHVTSEHDLFYCDICVTHLKLFSKERKLYTRELLEHHLQQGDAGDDSYSGHPLCDLCQQRYVDHDELYLHMRRDHYHCHLCDADDHQAFFRNVSELQAHFRRKHYLCEEGECRDKRLIVFRTNIDLQAHRASSHAEGSGGGGGGRRRQGPPVLTLQFSTAPTARRRRADRRGSQELLFESSSPATISTESRLEFPSLAGSPTGATPRPASSTASAAFSSASSTAFSASVSTPTATPTSATSPTSAAAAGLSFNLNRRPTHTNVTINVNRRTTGAAAAPSGVGSPTGTQPRISQVSSSGNITMQSPTMEQPPLIRGGRLVNDLESLYGSRQEQPPPPPPPLPPSPPPPPQSPLQSQPQPQPQPQSSQSQLQSLQQQSQQSPTESAPSPPPSPSLLPSQLPPTLPPPPCLAQTSTPPLLSSPAQPPPPAPRSYCGTNSVRFSVAGGGWTAPAEPLMTSPQMGDPPTSQLRHLTLGEPLASSAASSAAAAAGVGTGRAGMTGMTGMGDRRPRYSPPENLQARSCRLVKLARDLCRSEETLRTFRQLSAEFRCGQVSAGHYYSRCLSLLGAERLARLFPELLVLLPDIDKQTELLAAHEALNKDGSHRHKFLRCPTCCQILTLSDWGRHSALHFRNGEFPPECQ